MKLLMFLIVSTLSFSSHADLKPEGALVASLCGSNHLETVLATGPNYPNQVCIERVEAKTRLDGPQRPIISIQSLEGKKYYIVLTKVLNDSASETWYAFEVGVKDIERGYKALENSISLEQPGIELERKFNSGLGTLAGPFFEVELKLMAQTRSLK